jgi:hypothetical protein
MRSSRLAVAAVQYTGGAVDARLENPNAPFSGAAAISGKGVSRLLGSLNGDIGVGKRVATGIAGRHAFPHAPEASEK